MKIFGFNINKSTKTPENTVENTQQTFSGWRFNLPRDPNLPIVYNSYRRDSLIPFGFDGTTMGFPLSVEQSIYESAPAHSACIKLAVNSAISMGYEFVDYESLPAKDKIAIQTFKVSTNLSKFIKEITTDYRLHNRINIMVIKSNNSLTFKRISPAKIGYNYDKTKYFFSNDYASTSFTSVYDKYDITKPDGVYMLDFDGMVDKYDPYPAPEWLSGFKHIKINAAIPDFHDANMVNSINPSMVIKVPKEFKGDEKQKWFKELFKQKGVKETGNVMVFSGAQKDLLPEVQQLSANDNDKLFKELRESTIDDICMAHNVNPVLIGVKTPGSLGANQESELAWKIFNDLVVTDLRNHIEESINTLLMYSGITVPFKINKNEWMTFSNNDLKKITIE